MSLIQMLHSVILFVEYRDDTTHNASIWNGVFYSAGILCPFLLLVNIFTWGKKGAKSHHDA